MEQKEPAKKDDWMGKGRRKMKAEDVRGGGGRCPVFGNVTARLLFIISAPASREGSAVTPKKKRKETPRRMGR